jgi:hypothetical protein
MLSCIFQEEKINCYPTDQRKIIITKLKSQVDYIHYTVLTSIIYELIKIKASTIKEKKKIRT